jgi:hypothetical protein
MCKPDSGIYCYKSECPFKKEPSNISTEIESVAIMSIPCQLRTHCVPRTDRRSTLGFLWIAKCQAGYQKPFLGPARLFMSQEQLEYNSNQFRFKERVSEDKIFENTSCMYHSSKPISKLEIVQHQRYFLTV